MTELPTDLYQPLKLEAQLRAGEARLRDLLSFHGYSSTMSNPPVENVVIVGTGCAGLTAAIYTARANLGPAGPRGPQPGGQLTTTSEVENFPGFPEGVDGFQLMDNLRSRRRNSGRASSRPSSSRSTSRSAPQALCADRTILARSVIVATGASPAHDRVPGEKELYGGKGVTTCATCDGASTGRWMSRSSAAATAPPRRRSS